MDRMSSLANPLQELAQAATFLLPPPTISGSQWAAEYRVLSQEDSSAAGRWNRDARPYQNEILDVATDLTTERVSVEGASQWGKTQVLLCIAGYFIHIDPGPMMVVNPTVGAVENWSKTRFTPMVRDCPELRTLVSDQKSRDSSNTILNKRFPGGLLVGVGANAPTGLAAQPIRVLLMDEVDRFPKKGAGTEGDSRKLAEARTADFRWSKKIYECSSPTIKDESNIDDSYQRSDRRQWWITCPHCGHEQTLSFWSVIWHDRQSLADAFYACCGAGCAISEPELRRAVRLGRWIAGRPDVKGHAGFYVPGIMVKPMAELAKGFLEAKDAGPQELQVFYNTQLGELWNLRQGEEVAVEGLLKRARESSYGSGVVPAGVGLLVAAVDNQSSPQRLEFLVRGFGVGGEKWTIQHEVIPGNLALPEVWDRLQELILQPWPREDEGRPMRIKACALDIGGNFTSEVYKFCKRKKLAGITHPVKGATKPQAKIVRRSGKRARLFLVDGVAAKDTIYACLKIDKPGFGYQHFPNDTDQVYFEQLFAEKPCHRAGVRAYERVPSDAPNEILDLHVYCDAAQAIWGTPRDWAAMVAKAAEKPTQEEPMDEPHPTEEEPEQTPEEPAPAPAPAAVRVIRPKNRPGGAVTSTSTAGIPLAQLRGATGGAGGSGAW
jgi:phage terminase large subunit GpA-like protein